MGGKVAGWCWLLRSAGSGVEAPSRFGGSPATMSAGAPGSLVGNTLILGGVVGRLVLAQANLRFLAGQHL